MHEGVKRFVAATQVGALVLSLIVTGVAPASAVPTPRDPAVGSATTPARPSAAALALRSASLPSLRNLPLYVEPNVGQAPASAKFLARVGGDRVFFAANETMYDLRQLKKATKPQKRMISKTVKSREAFRAAREAREGQILGGVIRMEFVGGHARELLAEGKQAAVSHYYYGRDPSRWMRNVPTFAQVRYRDLYPGIDVVHYGTSGRIEYDVVVAPGADPRAFRVAFKGADRDSLTADGDILLAVNGREMRQRKPVAYQDVAGTRLPVESRYVALGSGQYGIEVGSYLASLPLVIDPLSDQDLGNGQTGLGDAGALDAAGNSYVTGLAFTAPACSDPVNPQVDPPGCVTLPLSTDGFVVKIATVNNVATVEWSVFFGGDGFTTYGTAIATDSSGNVVVGGNTDSPNLGVFPGGTIVQSNYAGGNDGWVAKLNSDGDAIFVTYLGGDGHDNVIALTTDATGNTFVTGGTTSATFPEFPAGTNVQGTFLGGPENIADAFVAKLSATGSAIDYYTIDGGTGDDYGSAITVSEQGQVIVTGDTFADTGLAAGSGDSRTLVAFGELRTQEAAVAPELRLAPPAEGLTLNMALPFPGTGIPGAEGGGPTDAFLLKMNATIAPGANPRIANFVLGGEGDDLAAGVGVDALGNIYVSGQTCSDASTCNASTFSTPMLVGTDSETTGGFDVFVVKLAPAAGATAPAVVYANLIGGSDYEEPRGIAVTPTGTVVLTGITTSPDGKAVPQVTPGDPAQVYLIVIPSPPTPTAAPVLTATDTIALGAESANTGTLKVATDIDGNIIVAGAPPQVDGGAPNLGRTFRTTIEPTIDIKPRAKKNNINLKTKTVQVAILSSPGFDASTRVDRTSIRFGHTKPVADTVEPENSLVLHKGVPKCWTKTRVIEIETPGATKKEKLKVKDLICRFSVKAAAFEVGNTLGYLTAKTLGAGTSIVGGRRAADGTFSMGDVVHIVPPKKHDKDHDCDADDEDWHDDDHHHAHHDDDKGKGKGKK